MIKVRGGDPNKKPARKPAAKRAPATDPKKAAREAAEKHFNPTKTAEPSETSKRLAEQAAKEAEAKRLAEDAAITKDLEKVHKANGETKQDVRTNGNHVFEIHPFSEAYPHMAEEIYQPFKEGILRNGQHEPIIVIPHPQNDNVLQIIDGRHRYTALQELDMPVKWKLYDGPLDDEHLREFVEAQNVHRRDLSQGQRAMSAAKLYTGTIGRPKKSSHDETDMTDAVAEEIAKRNGIGLSTFRKAVRVNRLAKRFPDFVDHVFEGRIQLAPAYDMVSDFEQTDTKLKTLNITTNDFKKLAEAPSAIGEILRRAKQSEKKKKRDERDEKIADIAQELPDEEFQVVYLDPPWKFETRSEQGMDRAAENHYPTMEYKAIVEAKPALADRAVVFLWVTNPFLAHGLDLLDSWGLQYKSNFVWHKDKEGNGYWNRQNHEILLVATTEKGFPAPLPGDQMPSCQSLPRGKHSEKPQEFAEWIEKTYPTAKKLEMYCRTPREGWSHWGYESNGVSLVDQVSSRDDDQPEDDEELTEDELREGEENASDPVDENKNAPQGGEDNDGFYDSALEDQVPEFLKRSKDPLGTSEEEPPGL